MADGIDRLIKLSPIQDWHETLAALDFAATLKEADNG